MLLTCLACNKPNQTTAACARCGCDLSELQAIVKAAAVWLAQAQTSLQVQDWAGALEQATQSWQLCHSAEAARLAFLAASADGQTSVALEWRHRAAC